MRKIAAAAIFLIGGGALAVWAVPGRSRGPERAERVGDAEGVRVAAAKVMLAIDANDADAFAAVSADRKDPSLRPLDRTAVEQGIAELHRRYGVMERESRHLRVEPSRGEVSIALGDPPTLLVLEFQRAQDGAWLLVNLSEGDPNAPDGEGIGMPR